MFPNMGLLDLLDLSDLLDFCPSFPIWDWIQRRYSFEDMVLKETFQHLQIMNS